LRRRGAVAEGLVPALEVRFERRRFVEPVGGARIGLDRRIRAPRANADLFRLTETACLPKVVLEIKGGADEPTWWLQALASLGFRRSALSKYGECAMLLFPRVHGWTVF
jgi:hypothetical protein